MKINVSIVFVLLLSVCFQFYFVPDLLGSDSKITSGDEIVVKSVDSQNNPLFINRPGNKIVTLNLENRYTDKPLTLNYILVGFSGKESVNSIDFFEATYSDSSSVVSRFGSGMPDNHKCIITGNQRLGLRNNKIDIYVTLKSNADLEGRLKISSLILGLSNGKRVTVPVEKIPDFRYAVVVRSAGQDNCNTYRIPGIVTTSSGMLIAVYDVRYNSSKDLEEDIDIGMSRSRDGGQTWEPMKIIMDMGEYGGFPQNENGVGDPCVLYNNFSNTLWVTAMWMCGLSPDKTVWWNSGQGLLPTETGQIMLIKSNDEGKSWTHPVNLTTQLKDPSWQLLFQGPGRGITMSDGTMVFPAQFKADVGEKAIDGGKYTSHSTIIYSADQGKSWKIGTGAKPNTTESQVVELPDGTLMLNMRDDLNRNSSGETNGRAVAITSDMGKTWTMHSSSNLALPEPNCMASIISSYIYHGKKAKYVLFFSNPNNKFKRTDLTVKASTDSGLTWPENMQVELYEGECFGYSCLTMVDNNTIGVLYEGNRDIFFQKIPVRDILGKGYGIKRILTFIH
jgi:sialidase-1